jgi:hypothetical protein
MERLGAAAVKVKGTDAFSEILKVLETSGFDPVR